MRVSTNKNVRFFPSLVCFCGGCVVYNHHVLYIQPPQKHTGEEMYKLKWSGERSLALLTYLQGVERGEDDVVGEAPVYAQGP